MRAALYFIRAERRGAAGKNLVLCAGLIVFLSFGMFTLTGLYPFITFNLGDRIMIYGGFLLISALATSPIPRTLEMGAVVVTILAVIGVSQHWKRWDKDVAQLAVNIRTNPDLRALPAGAEVFVSHHQYSRLGPFSHIELFTATYVVKAFFDLEFTGGPPFKVASFNRRLAFQDGALRDRKFGDVIPVGAAIWLYNSRANVLERVDAADIQKRIDALPDENRHWTQLIGAGWFKALVERLAPRLSYAY